MLDESDEQLARELMGCLSQTGYQTAFGNEEDSVADAGFDDFFSALNAYRVARASGDARAEAEAEDHLREVVRAELTGERRPS